MKNNFKNNIILRSLLITATFCVLLTSYFVFKKEQIVLQVDGKKTTVRFLLQDSERAVKRK